MSDSYLCQIMHLKQYIGVLSHVSYSSLGEICHLLPHRLLANEEHIEYIFSNVLKIIQKWIWNVCMIHVLAYMSSFITRFTQR